MSDLTDFQDAVKRACEAFGRLDWGSLENMLDNDVVMKRIDDPQRFHSGKRDVMHYFRTRGQNDKARLEYDPNNPNTNWVIVNGRRPIGVVSGTGRFFDTSKATQPRTIAFSFAFRKDGHSWLAINLWGAYAD